MYSLRKVLESAKIVILKEVLNIYTVNDSFRSVFASGEEECEHRVRDQTMVVYEISVPDRCPKEWGCTCAPDHLGVICRVWREVVDEGGFCSHKVAGIKSTSIECPEGSA